MIAIIITITVLELKVPHAATFAALRSVFPVFLSYLLSFTYVGIYWNNHHHLLSMTERVRGVVLWANMHLLFWLSLVPFVTAWIGENHFAQAPTVVYGVVLLAASMAYGILQRMILTTPGQNPALAAAIGRDIKGKICPPIYGLAILCAFFSPGLADGIYVAVALMWLIPDRRIEQAIAGDADKNIPKAA